MEIALYVFAAMAGGAIGQLVWYWNRRGSSRTQKEQAQLKLASNRDTWTTINSLGPTLSSLGAGLNQAGNPPSAHTSVDAVINAASDEYARAIQMATRRFPQDLLDAVFIVGLTWTTVELNWKAAKIVHAQSGHWTDGEELQRHIAAHDEALGRLQILVSNAYSEITEPPVPDAPTRPAS